MKSLRIGFLGLGGICRLRHVPGLKKIDGVEIVAVANRSRESGEAAARECGIPEVCDEWQDIVERDDIDAVFIGTWPYMHHAMSTAALEAGKHVFCQARMAMNAREARAMHAAARQAGRVAMLCPVPFGLSIDRCIARILREGRLGGVRLVQVESLSGAFADPATPMNWRKDHRLSGLNALTLGMYVEVIHRWFGWTQSVTAQTQIVHAERPGETGQATTVEIPDQILFSTRQQSGLAVQYTFSGVLRQGKDAINIHGAEGKLHYDVLGDALYDEDEAGNRTPVAVRPEDAYDVNNWRVEQDFIDAIRENKDYHPNFDDGLHYMEVTQAVHDAATQGKTITLPRESADGA